MRQVELGDKVQFYPQWRGLALLHGYNPTSVFTVVKVKTRTPTPQPIVTIDPHPADSDGEVNAGYLRLVKRSKRVEAR